MRSTGIGCSRAPQKKRLWLASEASSLSGRDVEEEGGQPEPEDASEDPLRAVCSSGAMTFRDRYESFCVHELSLSYLLGKASSQSLVRGHTPYEVESLLLREKT